jgi:hypothetical protein
VANGGDSGGGDGGYGTSLPPSSGPGDVESYLPNSAGDSWSYLTTSTNGGSASPVPFLDSVSVTDNKTVKGLVPYLGPLLSTRPRTCVGGVIWCEAPQNGPALRGAAFFPF